MKQYQYTASSNSLKELATMEKPIDWERYVDEESVEGKLYIFEQHPAMLRDCKEYESHIASLKEYGVSGTGFIEGKIYGEDEIELSYIGCNRQDLCDCSPMVGTNCNNALFVASLKALPEVKSDLRGEAKWDEKTGTALYPDIAARGGELKRKSKPLPSVENKVVAENIGKLCYDVSNDSLSPISREDFYKKVKETGEYYMPTNYDCFVAGMRLAGKAALIEDAPKEAVEGSIEWAIQDIDIILDYAISDKEKLKMIENAIHKINFNRDK